MRRRSSALCWAFGRPYGDDPQRRLDPTYTEEPPQDGERNVTLRRVGKIGSIAVAYHMPAAAHPDAPLPFVTVTNWIRAARRCGIDIEALFLNRGHEQYSGEPVTQLQHALQAAALAEAGLPAQRLGLARLLG